MVCILSVLRLYMACRLRAAPDLFTAAFRALPARTLFCQVILLSYHTPDGNTIFSVFSCSLPYLLLRQTFSCFLLFCLPAFWWACGHFPVLSCFVCRLFGGLADIFLFFLVLSADFLVGWQIFSCFLLFCLPTFWWADRHFPVFSCFVCRHLW